MAVSETKGQGWRAIPTHRALCTGANEVSYWRSSCYNSCRVEDYFFALRAEFQDLFPDRDLARVDAADAGDHVTVITLSQRTQNDMTSWNDDVEQERENLLQSVSVSHGEHFGSCV